MFENVDLHRFQWGSAYGENRTARRGEKSVLDRLDAWKVLQYLWEMSRKPQVDESYWPAYSLDDAVPKRSEDMWEMSDRAEKRWQSHEENPQERVPKKNKDASERPRSVLVAMPSAVSSATSPQEMKNEFDAHRQTVWDYTGGNPWRWKRKKRTPAGYQCEVLTFSGSEIVIPGPKSIEIPQP